MRIGVLTGGGDGPGLNAVIRSVTKSLIHQCGAEVIGIEDGFAGLMGERARHRPLDWRSVSGILGLGGTILGTSNRAHPFSSPDATARTLAAVRALRLDGLVAIGGDGTMDIAHRLGLLGVPIVGVPKTIDNDILGCERSFGFDTAVATATEALERVETTGQSHGRVMLLETMGRHAGWLALEAGLAASADIILLPEIDYDLQAIADVCKAREARQRSTLICVAEGAKWRGGEQTVAQRVEGRPEPVRLGGVAHALVEQLQPQLASEVRATVLGHVQRGGAPTAFDRVLATQYGCQAADLVRAGGWGHMVTLAHGRLGSVSLADVAHGCRTVPLDHPLLGVARQIGVCLGD